MDKIIIKNLLVRGIIGINDWERKTRQDILVNIDIFSPISKSATSDQIDDTVNYRTITKSIINLIENTEFFLVEALATEIAKMCLTNYPIEKIMVRIEKPLAVRFAQSVGVEIVRSRKDFS